MQTRRCHCVKFCSTFVPKWKVIMWNIFKFRFNCKRTTAKYPDNKIFHGTWTIILKTSAVHCLVLAAAVSPQLTTIIMVVAGLGFNSNVSTTFAYDRLRQLWRWLFRPGWMLQRHLFMWNTVHGRALRQSQLTIPCWHRWFVHVNSTCMCYTADHVYRVWISTTQSTIVFEGLQSHNSEAVVFCHLFGNLNKGGLLHVSGKSLICYIQTVSEMYGLYLVVICLGIEFYQIRNWISKLSSGSFLNIFISGTSFMSPVSLICTGCRKNVWIILAQALEVTHHNIFISGTSCQLFSTKTTNETLKIEIMYFNVCWRIYQ